MGRLIGMLLATAAVTLLATEVQAAKFTCKSAQELSRLGTHDSDTVVVEPDDANRECRFSINGEPAGSPPRKDLVDARNLLRAGTGSAQLRSGNVEWLALMLMAASREDAVPSDLLDRLRAHVEELAKCMEALENSDTSFKFDNGTDIFCSFFSADSGSVGFADKHIVEVQSGAPYYAVGARRGDFASYLFIPLKEFRGNPLP